MNVLRGDILQLLPFMIVAGAIVFAIQLALLLRSKKTTLKLLPIHIILIIGVTTILLTLFSYFVGQRYYPIAYPLKSIGVYVALTIACFVAMTLGREHLPVWASIVLNTAILGAFVAHIVPYDLPLESLPVIGKYMKKEKI